MLTVPHMTADSQGGISGIRGLERGSPMLRGVPQKTDQTDEARTMAGIENEKMADVYSGERERMNWTWMERSFAEKPTGGNNTIKTSAPTV